MSSIGSDPHLNVAGLNVGNVDRLDRQGPLDDLRRQPGTGAQEGVAAPDAAFAPDAAREASRDAGEDVLNAAAWDDVAPGDRLLAGDLGLEGRLGALDLGQAADSAVDTVLDAFA